MNDKDANIMKIVPWDISIRASYARSNELEDLRYHEGSLVLTLNEEEMGKRWNITFRSVQAFRVTTEECAFEVLSRLPGPGGFFEVHDSKWLQELGKGDIHFLEKSRHFIVSCYDEVVEVVSWDAQESLLD